MEMSKCPPLSSWLCPSPIPATHCARALRYTRTNSRALLMIVALLMIYLMGPDLVSAQEEEAQASSCSGSNSGLAAQFGNLKTALYDKAFVSLYGLSADIDPVLGNGVSVMYQCRGDLPLSACPVCVKSAFTFIAENCSDPSFAHVELRGCGVIQSNQRIQGDNNLMEWWINVGNGSTTFLQNRGMAIANVTQQAINNKQTLGTYWAVDVVGDRAKNETLCYALAQCHGYLSPSSCANCLSIARANVSTITTASLGARLFYGSCYIRYENFIFYNADSAPNLQTSLGPSAPALSPSGQPSPSPSFPGVMEVRPAKALSIGLVVVMVLVFSSFFCIVGSLLGWFSHSIMISKKVGKQNKVDDVEYADYASIQHFSLIELKKATNNFATDNKIGQGGSTVVYLGILDNGLEVAIKKLMGLSQHGKARFLNEVKLIRSLQHRNLVRIIGCSVEGDNDARFLVYEYLSNLSLDKHLFTSFGRNMLTWNKRKEILEGVARGLTYLHHDSHLRIIHRDIKVANILLDDDFNPKIADFGLAKLFASDKTHTSTRLAGTLGYIAPEYALNGQVSIKSDVFSFGLLMLEVISGRRNFEESSILDQQHLLHWTWRLHEEERELEMVDGSMQKDWVEEEVKRFICIALLCCQTSPAQRPSMLVVLEMLLDVCSVLDNPTMPAYITSSHTFSH